ncbi:GNAT family N-acetyltransferase [Cytobacillus sp. FJAT-54145]|uniref:GNAT family N-acetyltransferase n=1 Tax=Cytobacillus spartinae TaxID=3299023 RepID=A0ABW6KDA4_9BACI
MKSIVSNIQITEYNEKLAKGIAKMWNMSRDSWGGDTRMTTEEQTKEKEANSGNLALFLALDGEEVVGYCSLAQYKEDIGSLYIPLLNVRPDYHGKKIGKMLTLKALERTIELGWPRLDLYTWPGNTKAVPLYKKCGFFWEDRDDTTHLMNFIPTVLNTPLLKPLFTQMDWYEASVREIDVKPDGIKENNFTFYEYEWKNEDVFAKVQFERTGRGMCYLNTTDVEIELKLSDHECIEGQTETFELLINNKTGKPISVKAKNNHHERVKCNLDIECLVETSQVIKGDLVVLTGDEPSQWKTHPYLSITVTIDGKESEFRLGISPKKPATIEAKYHSNLCYLNKETAFEIEIQNSMKEAALFSITFPACEQVELKDRTLEVLLNEHERKTLSIPVTVKKHGFYHPELSVIAKNQEGKQISFEADIAIPFKGLGQKFGGQTKEFYQIFNGLSQVNIRKRDLLTFAGRNQEINQPFVFLTPRIGKPFSTEFTKAKPKEFNWETSEECITLKLQFNPDDFKGVTFTFYTSLYGEGIVKRWATIKNNESEIRDLYVSQSMYHEMSKTYYPLDNEIVYFAEQKELEYGDIKPEQITENWYFSEHDGQPIGVAWSPKSKVRPENWQCHIENHLGKINEGEEKSSEPIFLSIGAFQTWEEFRAFAKENTSAIRSETVTEKTFLLRNGRVISSEKEVEITLKSFRSNYLAGQLDVELNDNPVYSTTIDMEEETFIHELNIKNIDKQPVSILKGAFKEQSITSELKEMLLCPSDQKIVKSTDNEESIEILSINNGCMDVKVAPNFYPGIYSLSVKGKEWLDTEFPNLVAKGWWNPWAGGMKTVPSELNTFSLLKEESTAQFVEMTDEHQNIWTGIEVKTSVTNHTKYKGFSFAQYYLVLPGVPVLATFVKVMDSGGKNLHSVKWDTDLFVGAKNLTDFSLQTSDSSIFKTYQAGMEEHGLEYRIGNYVSSENSKDKMYIVESLDCLRNGAYMNKVAFEFVMSQKAVPDSNDRVSTKPVFLLFDERVLSSDLLKQLRTIHF